jgi:hypothetical protein
MEFSEATGLDFARATTNIAGASASSATFFTVIYSNISDELFAGAITCKA